MTSTHQTSTRATRQRQLALAATRLTLAEAQPIAQRLLEEFAPYCTWIQIGGSVRREKPEGIKDIELVMIPIIQPLQTDLFNPVILSDAGAEVPPPLPNPDDSLVLKHAQRLIKEGTFEYRLIEKQGQLQTHFGPKSQRVYYHYPASPNPAIKQSSNQAIAVDLISIISPAQPGLKILLATGPKDFNQRVVTNRQFGGLLPNDCFMKEGAIYRRYNHPEHKGLVNELIPTPTEESVFELLGMTYIEPKDRK